MPVAPFSVVAALVRRDLRARYSGAWSSLFWSIGLPLLQLGVYTFLFSVVLRIEFSGNTHYALYLFCGILPWGVLQEALFRGTGALREHGALLRWRSFPPLYVPLYLVVAAHLNECFGLGLLLLLSFLFGHLASSVLLLAFFLLFQFLFVFGLTLLLSALGLFFPNTIHFVSAGTTIWMYLTPIFYPPELVPDPFHLLIAANPLSHLVGAYRALLLEGRIPTLGAFLFFPVCALCLFALGWFLFGRATRDLGDLL